jgi:hypothetical protein
MKTIQKIAFLFLLLNVFSLNAQKKVIVKKGHHHHNKKVVVVKNGPHHPHKVYHPVWGPKRAFVRRWVFFPRYNFYWDNFNNVYVYRMGAIWVAKPTPPPVIINIDLSKEKSYELKETDDDVDPIQDKNDEHTQQYKAE